MKAIFRRLLNIRLSYIYPALFVLFMIGLSFMKPTKLTAGQLALYGTNSFLFGFFFTPLLTAQKARVDSLGKTIREETMTILDLLTQSHLLEPNVRHEVKVRVKAYLNSIYKNTKISADNIYYDELLHFSRQKRFEKDSVMGTIYERVSKTQENRDTLNNYLTQSIYSHEWMVALVLFSITIYFVMQTDYGGVFFFRMLLAILCTGLSLMLVILLKYSTLTHKAAKRIWVPLQELMEDHFEDVTGSEVAAMTRKIAAESAEA